MSNKLFYAAVSFLALTSVALAQDSATTATTPRIMFEQSTPAGAGNLVSISRAPVVTSTGALVYKDIQLKFDVSTTGDLTLSAGYPIITAAVNPTTGHFVAGRYKDAAEFGLLSGPGVGPAGRTSWSMDGEAGAPCLFSAGWTSGAVTGHPLQARLNAAKITYAGNSYGTMGYTTSTVGGACATYFPSPYFDTGALIGVAATANGLTIYSYTKFGTDQASPQASVSFQRCTTSAC